MAINPRNDDEEKALFFADSEPRQRRMPLLRVAAARPEAREGDAEAKPTLYRLDKPWTEASIPPRPWVAPGYLLRGSVTVLAGPGSAGKSSLVVAWSAAHALGVNFGRFKSFSGEPLKVLSYNVEDDEDELKRRYSAIARRLDSSPQELLRNLILVGPHAVGTLLTIDPVGGTLVNTRAMNEVVTLIEREKPDCVWLDPFVELHEVEENDNTAIRAVMATFRALAKQHKIAVGILFHTRKGTPTPGDPDQIRGASSIVGSGRVALTVNVMTKDEAEKLGIAEDCRRDFFRLDDAKKNYSRLQDAEWFERVEYQLDNGDGVAIPSPWAPPELCLDQSTVSKLVDLIAIGSPAGPYSPRLAADDRSIAAALTAAGIEGKAAQLQAVSQLKSSRLVELARFIPPRRSAADARLGFRTHDGQPSSANWVGAEGA